MWATPASNQAAASQPHPPPLPAGPPADERRLVRPAAAAQDAAPSGSSGSGETQQDGTVVFRFGPEADAASAEVVPSRTPALAAAASAAIAAAAPPAPAIAVVGTPAHAPAHASASQNGVAVLDAGNGAAAAHLAGLLHTTAPGAAAEPSSSSAFRHHYLGQEAQQAAHAGVSGSAVAAPPQQQHAAPQQALTAEQQLHLQPRSTQRQREQQQQRSSTRRPLGRGRSRRSGGSNGSGVDYALAAPDAASVGDYATADAAVIAATYDALCEARDLDEALAVVKECVRAGRDDALGRLKHYRFLRPAGAKKAVSKALRFVQLLPRQFADARTYNMLLKVCAEAGDLRNALHAADMLRAAGLQMDAILYTTLISACAVAGDAEQAFAQYAAMKADGITPDRMVYSSVVKACAETIDRLPPSERRQQLVLLERAFALVEDAKAARTPADTAVWNALVTAAGRAGQLQRAFNVLEDMIGSAIKPNDRTYASLINACARAGDKPLALRVYRKAQREGCAATLMVYSAAVHACVHAEGGCDADAAMQIYADMQRAGVEADNQFYGMLMRAAGSRGLLEPVLGLQAEMERDGLRPCAGTNSALMTVFVHNGRLGEAQAIFKRLRAAGEWPQIYAMNALLNAYAAAHRLGDVVSLVCEMSAGGLRPDPFTFSAIFNACQRADEAELALDVARLMKQHKVRMDETHCNLLLRICYSRLRQAWTPGGYPPHRADAAGGPSSALPGTRRTQERERLLEALTPRGRSVELRESTDVAWLAQAHAFYRETVAGGVKPTLRMLNYVLMCLRVAWDGKHTGIGDGRLPAGADDAPLGLSAEALLPHAHPAQLARSLAAGGAAGSAGGSGVPRQEKIGVESVYHVQAITILEEAIISNVVPSFKLDSDEPVDLRAMPPAVAEVYALTVLSAVQRQCEARRGGISQNMLLLVPQYDGAKVFMPSHLAHIDYERISGEEPAPRRPPPQARRSARSSYDSSDSETDSEDEARSAFADADAAYARASSQQRRAPDAPDGDERTGLGVAGVLRRLRLYAREYGDRGFILVESKELTRWCKAMQRAVARRSASTLPLQTYGQSALGMQPGATRLQQQQHQIRQTGLGPFGNTTFGSV